MPHTRPQKGVPTRTMKRLTLLLALAMPASLQAAEVYRWMDAQGLVHYSSVAPRDFAYERVDPGAQPQRRGTLANPRAANDGAESNREQEVSTAQPDRIAQAPTTNELGLSEEQRERRDQLQVEADTRRARLEEERQQQCERARRQYEQLTTHTRVRVPDGEGGERLLSDAELQTRIAAARDAIVTTCD